MCLSRWVLFYVVLHVTVDHGDTCDYEGVFVHTATAEDLVTCETWIISHMVPSCIFSYHNSILLEELPESNVRGRAFMLCR